MPTYVYECSNPECKNQTEEVRPVLGRNVRRVCDACNWGHRCRVFTPTANIHVHEHFRHYQPDLMPSKEDRKGWEARSSNSGYRASEAKKEGLAEHMEREMVEMGDQFWKPSG